MDGLTLKFGSWQVVGPTSMSYSVTTIVSRTPNLSLLITCLGAPVVMTYTIFVPAHTSNPPSSIVLLSDGIRAYLQWVFPEVRLAKPHPKLS